MEIVRYEAGQYRKVELCDNCRINEIDEETGHDFEMRLPGYTGEVEVRKLRLCPHCFRTATLRDMELRAD